MFSGEADESTEWEAGDVVVRVRSQKKDGAGGWGRKENGIVGRVVLSVAEVSLGCDGLGGRVRFEGGGIILRNGRRLTEALKWIAGSRG